VLSLPELHSAPLTYAALFVASITPFLGYPRKIDLSRDFGWVKLSPRSSPPPSRRNLIRLGLCPSSFDQEAYKGLEIRVVFVLA
jgi:hypothetical protein